MSILNKLCQIDRILMDMLYPPRCPVCDKVVLVNEGICAKCREKVRPIKEPTCMRCGKVLLDKRKEFCFDCENKTHSFIQSKALWVYDDDVKASLYRFKYQNKREYGKVYAKELAEHYGAWVKGKGIQGIIPIPLHKKRRRKRGYNQAQILAMELGEILGIPVYSDVLLRVRDTVPQKVLNDSERKNNLKKAFKTAGNVVELQYVLIVDDIYTTGATLDAAAEELLKAGVLKVYACCVSIGRGC